ncbi:hypothetical protein RRG08_028861 [Elysia crispata]|uniref:Uncharacterized protein n=1 Tax=Elysia crispata TaxID=231223 RepID=A0AAE0YYZ9_9GAST|nr:hypothetical protein RRG08_028861 [Elysia crispata]
MYGRDDCDHSRSFTAVVDSVMYWSPQPANLTPGSRSELTCIKHKTRPVGKKSPRWDIVYDKWHTGEQGGGQNANTGKA